jgi:hypothetical protein
MPSCNKQLGKRGGEIMRSAFISHLNKQKIILSDEQFDRYFHDFIQYCEEMEFTSEEEIFKGAVEYITCQIHYGLMQYKKI